MKRQWDYNVRGRETDGRVVYRKRQSASDTPRTQGASEQLNIPVGYVSGKPLNALARYRERVQRQSVERETKMPKWD